MTTSITYGVTCERTPLRTLALETLRAAAKAYALARALETREEGVDDGAAILPMRVALDHATRTAARLLPQGEVGGVLIEEAKTKGFEDGRAFAAAL